MHLGIRDGRQATSERTQAAPSPRRASTGKRRTPSRRVGVSRQSVMRWERAIEAGGIDHVKGHAGDRVDCQMRSA